MTFSGCNFVNMGFIFLLILNIELTVMLFFPLSVSPSFSIFSFASGVHDFYSSTIPSTPTGLVSLVLNMVT